MSTLYGVTCPYCKGTAYVHVPDTPSAANGEAESIEETSCNICGKVIIAYTKSSADWGVRTK